ncbi:unnamed protein product [Meganyctiphanes norvegica]|uniref:Chitin-binding type-1 domain-containing protein n=1 Tax=Meganyctiphanes norvegica TaxID=48144 RepID=A0AAV2RGY0_MEGNR
MVRCRTTLLLFGFTLLVTTQAQEVKWRDDIRCGAKENPVGEFEQFLLPSGEVAECDPLSEKPCCSSWGYCGGGIDENGFDHCKCDVCTDYRVVALAQSKEVVPGQAAGVSWRADRRCGAKNTPSGEFQHFALPTGQTAGCDPNSENYCCSAWGYCGGEMDENGDNHCDCATCINHRAMLVNNGAAGSAAAQVDNSIKWRKDRRCGLKNDPQGKPMSHLLPNRKEAECDPNGDNYCCSGWGFCGPADHCTCETCVDYRAKLIAQGGPVPEVKEKWRKDRRCGKKPAPNGDPLSHLLPNGQPAECNPNSEIFCCSAWGFCGGPEKDKNGFDHCSCETCQNFREGNPEFLGLESLAGDTSFSSGNSLSQSDSFKTFAESPLTSRRQQPQTFSRPTTAPVRKVEAVAPLVETVTTSSQPIRRRRPLRRRTKTNVATGDGRGTFAAEPGQNTGEKFVNARRFPGARQ